MADGRWTASRVAVGLKQVGSAIVATKFKFIDKHQSDLFDFTLK
jgi:hypothetical protein